jgi:hypothetical protein
MKEEKWLIPHHNSKSSLRSHSQFAKYAAEISNKPTATYRLKQLQLSENIHIYQFSHILLIFNLQSCWNNYTIYIQQDSHTGTKIYL